MPQFVRHYQIFAILKNLVKHLILEQKTLSNPNLFENKILVNTEMKHLMNTITWQDLRGLSWIFEEVEE